MMKRKQKTYNILGTEITITNMRETVNRLITRLADYRGQYISIVNVHTTVMAYEDAEYRHIQNHAVMALPDGKPLSLLCRCRGYREAERVAGPDLMTELLRGGLEKNYSHFFYGSTEATLTALKTRLLKKYPGIRIAGMYSPPFRPLTAEENFQDVERIKASQADYIWIGLGAPKQEKWMFTNRNRMPGVMLGVGAAFDFHAGTVKRAPKWMQEWCLEWLYRLSQDPKRLYKRYLLTNIKFIWLIIMGKA